MKSFIKSNYYHTHQFPFRIKKTKTGTLYPIPKGLITIISSFYGCSMITESCGQGSYCSKSVVVGNITLNKNLAKNLVPTVAF